MKLFLLGLMLFIAACTSKTEYGDCLGFQNKQDPRYEYEMSGKNVIVGVVLSETLIIPLIVVFDELYCPVRER